MARNHEMSGILDWWRKRSRPKQPVGPPPPIHIDLYDILRVPKDASQEAIKAAFRSLALMFHPDRNPGDPTAERKYAEISTAFAILGDDVQRSVYDRLRAEAGARPAPMPRGLVPMPGGQSKAKEEAKKEAEKSVAPPPGQMTMWEIMFGKPGEEEAQTGSMFDIFAKGSPLPPSIPSAQSPYGWAAPFQKKVPLTPQIDTPTPQEVYQIVQEWPLAGVWDLVRQERHTAAFHKAKAIAVDSLAGAGTAPAEWDLAEMLGIPIRQVDEFVRHRGRQAFFGEILYPIFDQITQLMTNLKPVDLPGQFFLDWDPSGRVIELIYTENVGRRPWE